MQTIQGKGFGRNLAVVSISAFGAYAGSHVGGIVGGIFGATAANHAANLHLPTSSNSDGWGW